MIVRQVGTCPPPLSEVPRLSLKEKDIILPQLLGRNSEDVAFRVQRSDLRVFPSRRWRKCTSQRWRPPQKQEKKKRGGGRFSCWTLLFLTEDLRWCTAGCYRDTCLPDKVDASGSFLAQCRSVQTRTIKSNVNNKLWTSFVILTESRRAELRLKSN